MCRKKNEEKCRIKNVLRNIKKKVVGIGIGIGLCVGLGSEDSGGIGMCDIYCWVFVIIVWIKYRDGLEDNWVRRSLEFDGDCDFFFRIVRLFGE